MTLSNAWSRYAAALTALLLIGCAESYNGPLADKPIKTETDERGQTRVVTLFNHLTENGVPAVPLDQAMQFFDAHKDQIDNQDWLSINDFSVHSGHPRMFVINLKTGEVDRLFVAHGIGSDPGRTGVARTFSDDPNSLMTSLGFYLVNESYQGKWGLSARLDGLQDSNSNARERAVVLHGATYVDGSWPTMGWTEGCPAVEMKWIETLVYRLRGRSLLYHYVEGL
ncbi:MAG: murein L,D-transpeptidase catalytic domain family protein [Bdellovibrionales bacterium]